MKHRFALKVLAFLVCAFFIFTSAGFTVFGGNAHAGKGKVKGKKVAPPSHVPAHGYRAKCRYRYYSGAHVYFDVGRKLYFFSMVPTGDFPLPYPGIYDRNSAVSSNSKWTPSARLLILKNTRKNILRGN